MHWATPYIGMPWVAGRSDCWNFARRVWQERFGWAVPLVDIDVSDARAARHALAAQPIGDTWAQVDRPVEGDAVLMAMGARPCHVGVWIEPESGPGVLHSVDGAGVIFNPQDRLVYRIVGFWRWRA